MTLVIPPGFGLAQMVLTSSTGTSPFVTTMGVDLSGWGGDYVAAANFCMQAYATGFLSETANIMTLDHVTLSVGQDGPGGSVDSSDAPLTGLRSAGNIGPLAISAIVRKSTDRLGRAGRGRMFLPGCLNEADVDADGSIVAARRVSLGLAALAYLNALDTGDAGPAFPDAPPTKAVLLHSPGAGAIPPSPILGLTISDIVGLQRGRIR